MRLVLFILVLYTSISCQQAEKSSSVTGVYSLISWQGVKEDGTVIYPYGESARGQLIYDTHGNMSMQLEAADRPNLGTDDYELLDSLALLNAYKTFFSYYGSYEELRPEGLVIHRIEGCKNPDWRGRELKRRIEWDNGNLIVRSDSVIGMDHILRWRRLP